MMNWTTRGREVVPGCDAARAKDLLCRQGSGSHVGTTTQTIQAMRCASRPAPHLVRAARFVVGQQKGMVEMAGPATLRGLQWVARHTPPAHAELVGGEGGP